MTKKLISPFLGISNEFIAYITQLQQDISKNVEAYEASERFTVDSWDRKGGGGGISMVLENGSVFEKAGVNISAIQGKLTTDKEQEMFKTLLKHQKKDHIDLESAEFFATGISLVIHPRNPFCPTVHMNYRYFEMKDKNESLWWFGGGADLTPAIEFAEDTAHFHATLKKACDDCGDDYSRFKKQCDDYFYLPHRQEKRGVGGIFFDYLNDKDQDDYFKLCQSCGSAFIESYFPIIDRRNQLTFTEEDKQKQLIKRGRYVEFNLLYDRGTLFGLKTGGRVESILMSLPPMASWGYKQ